MNYFSAFSIEQRRMFWKPLLIAEVYLTITFLLFLLGPIRWPSRSNVWVYLMVFFYQGMLALGYWLGIARNSAVTKTNTETASNRLMSVLILLTFLFVIMNFVHTTGMTSFSLKGLIQAVSKGLSEPAFQYKAKFGLEKWGGGIFTHFSVLFAPIFWFVLTVGIYRIFELGWTTRLILFGIIGIEYSRWIAIGTNKGVVDLSVVLACLLAVSHWARTFKNPGSARRRKKRAGMLMVLLLLSLSFGYFSLTIGDRLKSKNDTLPPPFDEYFDKDTAIYSVLPPFFQNPLTHATVYLTQGYHALSLATDLKFNSTFGFGHSWFLMENIKEFFGIDLFANTYLKRLEKYNWDSLVRWHTCYLWIANDVHFIGVGPVMFFLGLLFSSSFKDLLVSGNLRALPIFSFIFLSILYFPANNQVFSYPSTFVAFWTFFIWWLVRKRVRFVWRTTGNQL